VDQFTMAQKAVGLAFVAILITGAAAQAQVDLGKMLSSLTFGEPTQEQDVGNLPSPSDDEENAAGPELLPQPAIAGEGDEPINERQIPEVGPSLYSGDALPLEAYDVLTEPTENASQIAVPEVPSLAPTLPTPADSGVGSNHEDGLVGDVDGEQNEGARVDWDSVLASDNGDGENCADAELGTGDSTGECAATRQSSPCGMPAALSPFPTRVARPVRHLEVPNLPPPTTAAASYRTPACYRDLWGGFAEERSQHCQNHHEHLTGQCDCVHGQGKCCGAAAQYPFAR
jgi:hypothetical protein